MSPQMLKFVFIAMFAFCALATVAQTPSYGPTISLEDAKKAASHALAEACKNNWTLAVSIVDPACTLIYYVKMDNTQNGISDVSISNARSAARIKPLTKSIQD